MLIAIRDYFKAHPVCTLAELSTVFHTSPDAMRGMLLHWLKKGRIVCERGGCGATCSKRSNKKPGCMNCRPEELEIYRWQDNSGSFIRLQSV